MGKNQQAQMLTGLINAQQFVATPGLYWPVCWLCLESPPIPILTGTIVATRLFNEKKGSGLSLLRTWNRWEL